MMPGTGPKPKQSRTTALNLKDSKQVIGLTGNVACGKTAVSRLLAAKGHFVVDADSISREVVEPGSPVLNKIVDVFGKVVLAADGTLDRGRMRDLVFSDLTKRKQLEAILHPAIIMHSEEKLAQCLAEANRKSGKKTDSIPKRIVFYDAALIVETGRHKSFGGLLVVTSSPALQKQRLMARDHLTEEAADRIIKSQMSQQEKSAQADWVIENNGTLAELETKVDEVIKQIQLKNS